MLHVIFKKQISLSILFVGLLFVPEKVLSKAKTKMGKRNKTIEVSSSDKESVSKDPLVGSKVIQSEIDNSWGYDRDDVNFISESVGPLRAHSLSVDGVLKSHEGITKEALVLVNLHGREELYLGPVLSGPFKSGLHRSLSWATPLENAVKRIKRVVDAHDDSALLKSWSGDKYRSHVSFIYIPEGTRIEYKIGNAVEQGSVQREHREGGGVQLRLKYIPEGAIVITRSLGSLKKELSADKGYKRIDLHEKLLEGIREHNEANPDRKIEEEIAHRHYIKHGTDTQHFQDRLDHL